MLSTKDLNSIGKIINDTLEIKLEEKLEEKLEAKLEEKLEEKLSPITRDIQYIKTTLRSVIDINKEGFDNHEGRICHLEKKVFPHTTE